LGWAPCIGPTLIAVNTLAFSVGDVPRATALALAYCAGLGIPFLLIALGFSWVTGAVGWLRKHIRAINITGGVILMAIGTAMVSGVWQFWMSSLQAVIGGTTTPL
jgi:cytochrome c-type biogenesis protein